MNLPVLEIVYWILSIRGHIPQFGEHECPPARSDAPGPASRVVIGLFIAPIALALALWLAIRLI
jgi:hypothetical protein